MGERDRGRDAADARGAEEEEARALKERERAGKTGGGETLTVKEGAARSSGVCV